MKEFNLQLAKAGKPVCTRDGKTARIVCWDRKWEEFPLLVLVTEENGDELAVRYTINGRTSINSCFSQEDLMMATDKKKAWINLFRSKEGIEYTGLMYQSHDEAVSKEMFEDEKIATIKIEWEE